MKPIETFYDGHKFRSRLEARWAVFFNSMGIKYQYEPEGFQINFYDPKIKDVRESHEFPWGSFYYLPDFYLPKQNLWVEVKGDIQEETKNKIIYSIDYQQLPGNKILLVGEIPNWRSEDFSFPGNSFLYPHCIISHEYFYWNRGVERSRAFLTSTEVVESLSYDSVHHYDSSIGNPFYCDRHGELDRQSDKALEPFILDIPENKLAKDLFHEYWDCISKSYDLARQARFEHGQKG